MLVKQGSLPDNKIWIAFHKPNNKEECVGYVLISMQILTIDQAEMNPVGEAQEEPNVNPKLIAPTEGRGYGDAIGSALSGIIPDIALP